MIVQPAFESRLEFGKVDDSADGIDIVAGDVEVGDVIVTVKKLTLTTVLVKTMSRTKFDATHNLEVHDCLSESTFETAN